jgi:hypothetical protein
MPTTYLGVAHLVDERLVKGAFRATVREENGPSGPVVPSPRSVKRIKRATSDDVRGELAPKEPLVPELKAGGQSQIHFEVKVILLTELFGF